jgi:hypothetical protein
MFTPSQHLQGETLKHVLEGVKDINAASCVLKAKQYLMIQNLRILKIEVAENQELPIMFRLNWNITEVTEINNAIQGRSPHSNCEVLKMLAAVEESKLKIIFNNNHRE